MPPYLMSEPGDEITIGSPIEDTKSLNDQQEKGTDESLGNSNIKNVLKYVPEALLALFLSVPGLDTTQMMPESMSKKIYGTQKQLPFYPAITAEGKETPILKEDFSDVPRGEWFSKHVYSLVDKGVVQGPRKDKKYKYGLANTPNKAAVSKMIDDAITYSENRAEFEEHKEDINTLMIIFAVLCVLAVRRKKEFNQK